MPLLLPSGPIIKIENVSKTFGTVDAIIKISTSKLNPARFIQSLARADPVRQPYCAASISWREPDEGQIFIDGEQLSNNQKLLNRLRTKTAMVFQQFNLYPH